MSTQVPVPRFVVVAKWIVLARTLAENTMAFWIVGTILLALKVIAAIAGAGTPVFGFIEASP